MFSVRERAKTDRRKLRQGRLYALHRTRRPRLPTEFGSVSAKPGRGRRDPSSAPGRGADIAVVHRGIRRGATDLRSADQGRNHRGGMAGARRSARLRQSGDGKPAVFRSRRVAQEVAALEPIFVGLVKVQSKRVPLLPWLGYLAKLGPRRLRVLTACYAKNGGQNEIDPDRGRSALPPVPSTRTRNALAEVTVDDPALRALHSGPSRSVPSAALWRRTVGAQRTARHGGARSLRSPAPAPNGWRARRDPTPERLASRGRRRGGSHGRLVAYQDAGRRTTWRWAMPRYMTPSSSGRRDSAQPALENLISAATGEFSAFCCLDLLLITALRACILRRGTRGPVRCGRSGPQGTSRQGAHPDDIEYAVAAC